jgi:hypothetical protein
MRPLNGDPTIEYEARQDRHGDVWLKAVDGINIWYIFRAGRKRWNSHGGINPKYLLGTHFD